MADTVLTSPPAAPAISKPIRRSPTPGGVLRSYAFRSVIQAVLTIFAVTTFTFFLIRLLPSDPVQIYIDKQMQSKDMTYEAALAKASLMFGADLQAPVLQQYISYFRNVLQLNLGESITSPGTSVISQIAAFLPWTLFSVGLGLLVSFVIGLFTGMLMAYVRNSFLDTVLSTVASFLSSVPNYLTAILIVFVFGVQLQWFSVAKARDAYSPGVQPGFTLAFILDVFSHAALPVFVYFLSTFGGWALTMKNSTLGVLGEEYVTAAHARGLGRWRIITSYVGRNAALPLVTQLALSIGTVVGGAIIIEQYFVYPGIGRRLVLAIQQRDYTIMQGIFLVTTTAVVVANLLADLLYSQLDPRVRSGK